MGLGGVGIVQLLIIAVIVILIFGSKRIRQLGQDMGGMIRGFRGGFKELEEAEDDIQDLKKDYKDASDTIRRISGSGGGA